MSIPLQQAEFRTPPTSIAHASLRRICSYFWLQGCARGSDEVAIVRVSRHVRGIVRPSFRSCFEDVPVAVELGGGLQR
jgi:hypothetical protein